VDWRLFSESIQSSATHCRYTLLQRCRALLSKCRALLQRYGALLQSCRALLQRYRALFQRCIALLSRCEALWHSQPRTCEAIKRVVTVVSYMLWIYVALLQRCMAVFQKCRVLLSRCRALLHLQPQAREVEWRLLNESLQSSATYCGYTLLQKYRALLKRCRAILQRYRALLSRCRALLHSQPGRRVEAIKRVDIVVGYMLQIYSFPEM